MSKSVDVSGNPKPVVLERIPRDLMDRIEDLNREAKPKVALLMMLSEAQSFYERGGVTPGRDKLAWRGVESLLADVLRDLECIEQAAFDEEGGER